MSRLDIDFAAAIRGNRDQVWTADLLWSRLRKDRILAIARETLGEAWAQAYGKDKKTDLAAAMQEAFAHGDGMPCRGHGRGPSRGNRPGRRPAFAPSTPAAVDDNADAGRQGGNCARPETGTATGGG